MQTEIIKLYLLPKKGRILRSYPSKRWLNNSLVLFSSSMFRSGIVLSNSPELVLLQIRQMDLIRNNHLLFLYVILTFRKKHRPVVLPFAGQDYFAKRELHGKIFVVCVRLLIANESQDQGKSDPGLSPSAITFKNETVQYCSVHHTSKRLMSSV